MVCFNLFHFKLVEFYKTEINTLEFSCVFELEPNILVEDTVENKNEKDKIINLLIENSDSKDEIIKILKRELETFKNDLQAMKSSKSWKITAPLRKIKKIYREYLK